MMQHRSFIRHLVRISKPALAGTCGTREVQIDEPEHAFEPSFWCGLVNGKRHKYNDQAVIKKWRVWREVDRDGDPVDERVEQLFPEPNAEAAPGTQVPAT